MASCTYGPQRHAIGKPTRSPIERLQEIGPSFGDRDEQVLLTFRSPQDAKRARGGGDIQLSHGYVAHASFYPLSFLHNQ